MAGDGGAGQPLPAYSAPILQPGIPTPVWPEFGPAVGPTGLYAGGGGGGKSHPEAGGGGGGTNGSGGPGGGGAADVDGKDNTGGGGGARSPDIGANPTGATGIVVIRYQV